MTLLLVPALPLPLFWQVLLTESSERQILVAKEAVPKLFHLLVIYPTKASSFSMLSLPIKTFFTKITLLYSPHKVYQENNPLQIEPSKLLLNVLSPSHSHLMVEIAYGTPAAPTPAPQQREGSARVRFHPAPHFVLYEKKKKRRVRSGRVGKRRPHTEE